MGGRSQAYRCTHRKWNVVLHVWSQTVLRSVMSTVYLISTFLDVFYLCNCIRKMSTFAPLVVTFCTVLTASAFSHRCGGSIFPWLWNLDFAAQTSDWGGKAFDWEKELPRRPCGETRIASIFFLFVCLDKLPHSVIKLKKVVSEQDVMFGVSYQRTALNSALHAEKQKTCRDACLLKIGKRF